MKAITLRRNITNTVDQRLLIVTEINIDPIGHLFQSVTVCSFTTFLTNNFVFFMNSLAGYSSIKFALNFISVFFARICYIVKGAPFLQVNL